MRGLTGALIVGLAIFAEGGTAAAEVPGTCGRLPLPPSLAGKNVVLAIPANRDEARPCAPGTVVVYTLVDGRQVFLPVVATQEPIPVETAKPVAAADPEDEQFIRASQGGNANLVRPRAEAGDAKWQFLMGSLYQSGEVGPKHKPTKDDHAQAFLWFDRAANQGHLGARMVRAIGALSGTIGKKNCGFAISELNAMMSAGHVPAVMYRGYASQFGKCVPQDYAFARALYQRTVAEGGPVERDTAQAWLGIMGDKGLPRNGGGGDGFLGTVATGLQTFAGVMNQHTADLQRAREQDVATARVRAAQLAQAAERQRIVNAGGRPSTSIAGPSGQAAAPSALHVGARFVPLVPQVPTAGGMIAGVSSARSPAIASAAPLNYYPEALVYCTDIRPGAVNCVWEGGEIDGFNDTRFASDVDFLGSISRYCAGIGAGSGTNGSGQTERLYRCDNGGWSSFTSRETGAIRNLRYSNQRRIFRCAPGVRRCTSGG